MLDKVTGTYRNYLRYTQGLPGVSGWCALAAAARSAHRLGVESRGRGTAVKGARPIAIAIKHDYGGRGCDVIDA